MQKQENREASMVGKHGAAVIGGALLLLLAPAEIIERVATSLLETLRQPTLHEQLRSQGFEVIGNGPDGLRPRIEREVPAYRDLIVKAGIAPV
jgi:hypothetical protein